MVGIWGTDGRGCGIRSGDTNPWGKRAKEKVEVGFEFQAGDMAPLQVKMWRRQAQNVWKRLMLHS